jgi:hypothetical protein
LTSEAAVKIRFETTIDDVIAFNRFHFASSPAWRRQVWTQTLLVPAILVAMYLLLRLTTVGVVEDFEAMLQIGWFDGFLAIFFAAASIAWGFFIRWHMNSSLERNARRFLSEGSNRVIFGWREMELVNNRLLLKNELIESSLDLRAIEKIVGNDQYTFVYIAAAQAYLIPMHLYPEDEYREFVAELREAWENRDSPIPPDEDAPDERQADERIVERPR